MKRPKKHLNSEGELSWGMTTCFIEEQEKYINYLEDEKHLLITSVLEDQKKLLLDSYKSGFDAATQSLINANDSIKKMN